MRVGILKWDKNLHFVVKGRKGEGRGGKIRIPFMYVTLRFKGIYMYGVYFVLYIMKFSNGVRGV